VALSRTVLDPSSRCPPDVCVAAVLGDALHRVSVLGGREGVARSLGSVYGGAVTRFLGSNFSGDAEKSSIISTLGLWSSGSNSLAVSRDGRRLLAVSCWRSDDDPPDSEFAERTDDVWPFDLEFDSSGRYLDSRSSAPSVAVSFDRPEQLWVASDGFVFVADRGSRCVHVLTPTLTPHGTIGGGGLLRRPVGVCANADIVVVSQRESVVIFRRSDSSVQSWFDGAECCDHCQQLGVDPSLGGALCFMCGDRRVAIVDYAGHAKHVHVFSIDGTFIRAVGAGVLEAPNGIACSAYDELVVSDRFVKTLYVFSDTGDLLKTLRSGMEAMGVAIYGCSVFALCIHDEACQVWT
jgi:hypothetical protein